MAKKMNLLLTVSLAVICLAALILGLTLPMQATPAQAAGNYNYEKLSSLGHKNNVGAQVVILNTSGSTTYAISADSESSAVLVSVQLSGGELDPNDVTDSMLWTIELSGNYFAYKNVQHSSYLGHSIYQSKLKLESTIKTFYSGSDLNDTSNDKYLYVSGSSLNYGAYSMSTTWLAYKKVLALENPTTITYSHGITGDDAANVKGKMDPEIVEANSEYVLPNCAFTLTNYKFKNWLVNGEAKNAGDTVTITEDTTITAEWEDNYWVVTCKWNDSTVELKADKTAGISLPDSGTLWTLGEHEMHDYWVVEGTETKITGTYKPTADTTVTPVLKEAVNIHFDFAGGTTTSSSFADKKVAKGYSFYLSWGSSITAPQYRTFLNWVRSDTGEKVTASGYITINEDITFTAEWKFTGHVYKFVVGEEEYYRAELAQNQANATLYFYSEQPESSSVTQITFIVPNPSVDGWTFKGWLDESGNTWGNLNSEGKFSHSPYWYKVSGTTTQKTIVIKANLTRDLTVNYKLNGDILFTKQLIGALYDGKLALSTNEQRGYPDKLPNGQLFDHWEYDGQSVTSINYADAVDGVINIDIITKEGYKLSFDLNGGSQHSQYVGFPDSYWGASYVVTTTTGTASLSYTSYQPHKDAHIFTGWKCGDLLVTDGTQFDVTSDMKFVAQWKFDGITLNFADDDSTKEVQLNKDAESYVIDFDWTVPAGKVLEGWKLTGDDSDTLYKKGDTVTIPQDTEEMNFVAQIRDLKTYVVTLHYGSLTQTLEFVEGTANITILEKDFVAKFGAVPADKKFISWYAEADFVTVIGVSYLTANDATMTDLHVYAKVVDRLTVTFNFAPLATTVTRTNEDGNGVAVMTATDAEAVTREGYNLRGWSKTEGGSADYYLTSPAIKESCTLYAVWEATPEQALANAKQAAKDEIAAAATEADVTAPATTSIDAATTIDEVNTAKAAALEIIAQAKADKESAAKLADVNAAIAALSGKKGEQLFTAIKAVEAKLNALTEDELEQVNLTAYNAAKTAYNAYVTATVDDLGVAEDMAMAAAAVELATAVTAMAMLAFVLKRRMW